MDFDEAARRVHLGRSILFTGAGFSHGATSVAGKALTDATGLANVLSARLGEEPLPLDVVTDQYLERYDPKSLVREIHSHFMVSTREDHHQHISRLPWRRVYTTNYDNLFEYCRRADGAVPSVLTLSDDPGKSLDLGSIIHLNGFAERISPSFWDPDIILTTTDYLTDKVRNSAWAEVLRSDLSMADAVIFMGYSLYDIDVARILYENPDIVKKTFFVVGETADRATILKTGRLGLTLARNVSDIANQFPAAGDPQAPNASPFPVNLIRREFEPSRGAASQDDVVDFLTKGDLDLGLLTKSVIDGRSDYYVSRSGISQVAKAVVEGTKRLMIHSDLGNGKSLSALELGVLLSVAGFNFYEFSGSTEGFNNDFDYLSSITGEERSKTAILFEDGLSFGETIKIVSNNFPEVVIIATSRSSAIETRLQSISDALGDHYALYELNDLSDDEARELSALMLNHGLWGERQGWGDDRRLDFIQTNCGSHLSSLLLSVCKSTVVKSRLGDLVRQIVDYKDPTYESLIVVLVMAYIGKNLTIAQVCEIVRADLFKAGKVQRSEVLGEFVHFARNRVSVRSPMFAQAVLTALVPDHVLIDRIPEIVLRLEQLGGHNDFYRAPARRMMRFGAIERLLSNPDKEQKLVAFYENLRATGVVNQNPQFWLQYAIARMSFKDYPGAERNFQAAFGLVKGRSYDPYQIENQHARFLLESRAETNIWDDYFPAFEEAHRIIRDQMRRVDEGDYPYNVATNYLRYIESKHRELDQSQLDRVLEWCDELLVIAQGAHVAIKRRGYWKNFSSAMSATKDLIREVR